MTNELIARICQSFVALESLELLFGNIQMQYPTILESFQQARFRNTLHTFKVSQAGGFYIPASKEPFDYLNMNRFPALHTVNLMVTNDLHVIEHVLYSI